MSSVITMPRTHEVHLWLVWAGKFMEPAVQDKLSSWLAADEKQRVNRLQFDVHRQRLTVSRGLLRRVLSIYYPERDPGSWKLQGNPYGRPAIASEDYPSLHFNVSHSGEHLVIAVATHPLLGVDVEQVKLRKHMLDIARRHFSAQEYSELMALDTTQQRQRFFDLWTLKEAYIKARGMGLAIPLHQFSFAFAQAAEIRVVLNPDDETNASPQASPQNRAADWTFRLYDLKDARLALALRPQAEVGGIQVVSRELRELNKWSDVALRQLRPD